MSGMTVMTDTEAYLSVAEFSLEVACEWIDPYAFDGLSAAMERIEFAAPFGTFEVLPVGHLVACAGKAGLLDEGFEQHRAIAITGGPVVG